MRKLFSSDDWDESARYITLRHRRFGTLWNISKTSHDVKRTMTTFGRLYYIILDGDGVNFIDIVFVRINVAKTCQIKFTYNNAYNHKVTYFISGSTISNGMVDIIDFPVLL